MQIRSSHAPSKALITPANYGTAEAVPFVQQRNSKLAPREKDFLRVK
jgi:hypothetical protein